MAELTKTERMIIAIKEAKIVDSTDLERIEAVIYQFYKDEAELREIEHKLNGGKMTFGKYKSKSITDIFKSDPSYIMWLKQNTQYLSKTQKAILETFI
jgi:hypothetical protein